MTAAEQALSDIVLDLALTLEVAADSGGLRPAACADALERLYTVLDDLPEDGRRLMLAAVEKLLEEEAAGPNREERMGALRGLRDSVGTVA